MTAVTTRPVTLHLLGYTLDGPESIGTMSVALVVGLDPDLGLSPGAWVITHMLGTPAGGTHTEVVLDHTAAALPEHMIDDLVRQVAGIVYGPGRWAFHYRPEQVADRVLAHGSRLRERIEVTAVELWTEVPA